MYAYPKVQVTRVNLRPLASKQDLERLEPSRILRGLQQSLLKRIRAKILQETFSTRAKRALYEGVAVKVGPKSITVVAKHPAFRPLLEGQRPKQMRWLTKAKSPIPIVTESGELIFRSATPRSMDNGSWYHPGRQPTTVIERAKAEARQALRENIARDLRKQLRAAFQKGTK